MFIGIYEIGTFPSRIRLYNFQPKVKEFRKMLSHLRHFYFQGVFDLKNGGDIFWVLLLEKLS